MNFRRLWQQWFGNSRKRSARQERAAWRRLRCEPLEERRLLTVNFTPVLNTFTSPASKDLLIPLTATDSNGGAITYSVTNNTNGANVQTSFITGGTTLVFNVSGKNASNADFTGNITVRLFDALTPNTVERIRELISQQYYDGLTFHRIAALNGGTNGRIAQGGDPNGNGTGGPGTEIDDEFDTSLTFNSPGLLAMAKSNDDTNGSQFFFVNADAGLANSPQHLNFNHTILGQVVAGFDVLNNVMTTPASTSGTPSTTMRISSVRETTDNQNGILRVHPSSAAFTGNAALTVVATGSGGLTSSQTFNVTIATDTTNDAPILQAFPAPFQGDVITTSQNTPVSFTLTATDLENDALTFQVVSATSFSTPPNIQVQVTGNQVTLTPNNGFVGTVRLRAEVSDRAIPAPGTLGRDGNLDAQEFTLVVGDVPTATFELANTSVTEGAPTAIIVKLSQTSSTNVRVNLGYHGTAILNNAFPGAVPSDYSSALSVLIPGGQGLTSASISLTTVNDTIDENAETVVIDIESVEAGLGSTGTATLTIEDNDPTPVSLSVSSASFNENGGSTRVIATLPRVVDTSMSIAINYSGSAVNNTDYSAASATIVIAAGQSTGSVLISAINDSISEGPETFVASLGAITGGGGGGVATTASSATLTIVDDEPLPQASLSISALTFAEKSGSATITARITNGVVSANPTTINLNFVNGTATGNVDFSSFTTITIPAGQSTGSVTIFGIDDSIPELDETFTVAVGTVTNGSVSPAFSQTVTITSDEAGIQDFKLASTSDDGSSSTDGYISNDTPTFNFQAPANQSITFEINGTSAGSSTAGASGSGTFTVPVGKLKIGDNTIRAIVGSGASQTSSTTSITYAPKLDEGYHIGGDVGATQNVSFQFDARQALYRSEVGVYIADDSTGRVGSLSPGQAGYAKAALERAQTLFVRGVAVGANQVIALSGGQVLGFYMVQSGTRTQALATNPNNNPPGALGIGGPVTFFSFDAANPDGVRHVQVVGDPLAGSAEYRWEDLFGGGDMDFNDFVFTVKLASSSAQPTMETLRVPVASTVTASTTFTLQAPLAAPNTTTNFSSLTGEFGIFKITSPSGTVGSLSPGDSGWIAQALASTNRTSLFSAGAAAGATRSVNLSGADRFGFYRIVGGTADQLLSSNANNSSTGSIYALVSFDPANPDDADHFRWYAPENANQGVTGQGTADDEKRLHIMDKLFGGDSDFDAFTVKIDF